MKWRLIRNVGEWADYKVRARQANSKLPSSAFPRIKSTAYPFLVPEAPLLDTSGVLIRVSISDAKTLLGAAGQE